MGTKEKALLTLAGIVVALVGVVVYANLQSQEADTPSLTKEGDGGSSDATASWKTYRNEEYGFEVKYPPSATVSEMPAGFDNIISGIGFGPIFDSSNIRVMLRENSRGDKTLEELFEVRNNVAMMDTGNINDYQELVINDQKVLKRIYRLDNGEPIAAEAVILGKNYYFVVQMGNQYEPRFDSERELAFDRFISTFKVIEPVAQADTAGWKTYKAADYGFEVLYPSKYSVESIESNIYFSEPGVPSLAYALRILDNPGKLSIEKFYDNKQKQGELLDISGYKTKEVLENQDLRIVLYQNVPDMVAHDWVVAEHGDLILQFLQISNGEHPSELINIVKSIRFN